jgi:hypothetical protein
MTDSVQLLALDFHLEPDDRDADLERSAAEIRQTVSALPGVDEVDAEVADEVRMIDPVSAGAILLTVTASIKNAGDLVESLDDLVNNVKKLARDAGLVHLWVWLHRKKVKVEDLTADDFRELAAEASDT